MLSDIKTIYHLITSPAHGEDHAQRMESFYRHQAGDYDQFRDRLLKGRRELYEAIPTVEGGVMVDMGGGTGSNLEFLGEALRSFAKVYIVDISPPLLAIARNRVERLGWKNVEVVSSSACDFVPEEKVDVVTFSYSLSMMPDWFAVIDHAHALLKAGGRIGTVDFYISSKFPKSGRHRHGWWTRTFWPAWFARDNVNLAPDQLEYLHYKFTSDRLSEEKTKLPYVPGILGQVPYYWFVGTKAQP